MLKLGKVKFNVDAYTARLIGRENISGLRGALFELVKNSYDADASVCILYYSNGKLYLADNGTGMSSDVILNNWMTIGRSTKKKILLLIKEEFKRVQRELEDLHLIDLAIRVKC